MVRNYSIRSLLINYKVAANGIYSALILFPERQRLLSSPKPAAIRLALMRSNLLQPVRRLHPVRRAVPLPLVPAGLQTPLSLTMVSRAPKHPVHGLLPVALTIMAQSQFTVIRPLRPIPLRRRVQGHKRFICGGPTIPIDIPRCL